MGEDVELLRMAAFKLKEAAGRLKGLARLAKSPDARSRLDAAAAKLVGWESELWASFGEDGDEPPPPPAKRTARSKR